MKRLKVYGWTALIREPERSLVGIEAHRIQGRCIVAASSMAEVGRLLNRRPGSLFNLCETGNAQELTIALAKPRTFFAAKLDGPRTYHEVQPEAVA